MITANLAAAQDDLRNNYFGRFALNNCNVRQYKSRSDAWREQISASDRKRKLFDDLFAEDTMAQPKKRARSEQKKDKKHKADDEEAGDTDKVQQVLDTDTKWVSDKHKRAMKALMGGLEANTGAATTTTTTTKEEVAATNSKEPTTTKKRNKKSKHK